MKLLFCYLKITWTEQNKNSIVARISLLMTRGYAWILISHFTCLLFFTHMQNAWYDNFTYASRQWSYIFWISITTIHDHANLNLSKGVHTGPAGRKYGNFLKWLYEIHFIVWHFLFFSFLALYSRLLRRWGQAWNFFHMNIAKFRTAIWYHF